MRTFVALLVVANLAMFVWAGWLREPVAPVQAPAADGLLPFEPGPETLVMLSELPEGGAAETPRLFDIPTELSGTQTDPSETAAVPGEPAETLSAATTATAARSPETPLPQDLDTTAARPPEPPLPQAADATAARSPETPTTTLASTSVPVSEGPAWCADLGLFAERGQAEALLPELLLLGVDARLVQGRRPVGITHWVHTRLFASEAEARELLSELQSRNIDSFYMRDGELAGRISLGVFSRAESAARLQEMLRTQGYTAEVSQVRRQEERFWLALEAPSRAVLEAEGWRALASRTGLTQGNLDTLAAGSLSVSEKVCEPVATPNQFP